MTNSNCRPKPVLREFVAKLGVSLQSGDGKILNTRALGAGVMAAIRALQ